jgi:hypothetical protein
MVFDHGWDTTERSVGGVGVFLLIQQWQVWDMYGSGIVSTTRLLLNVYNLALVIFISSSLVFIALFFCPCRKSRCAVVDGEYITT